MATHPAARHRGAGCLLGDAVHVDLAIVEDLPFPAWGQLMGEITLHCEAWFFCLAVFSSFLTDNEEWGC